MRGRTRRLVGALLVLALVAMAGTSLSWDPAGELDLPEAPEVPENGDSGESDHDADAPLAVLPRGAGRAPAWRLDPVRTVLAAQARSSASRAPPLC